MSSTASTAPTPRAPARNTRTASRVATASASPLPANWCWRTAARSPCAAKRVKAQLSPFVCPPILPNRCRVSFSTSVFLALLHWWHLLRILRLRRLVLIVGRGLRLWRLILRHVLIALIALLIVLLRGLRRLIVSCLWLRRLIIRRLLLWRLIVLLLIHLIWPNLTEA